MRISFHVPGYVYTRGTERNDGSSHVHGSKFSDKEMELIVEDDSTLSALSGWCYRGSAMYNYLDMELIDQGIVGGIIRVAWTAGSGLEIIIDYWAPDTLHHSYISRLRDETIGQLSDGIGECGFEVLLDERKLLLVADTDATVDVEQVYDGKPIPMPSRVARAARDGDMALLNEALASGEPIDSLIQGYSGLHLAITFGHIDAALLLISKGANVNLRVRDGNETPLHVCALTNSLSDSDSATVASALLSHGADKTIKTASGDTAASFAENRRKTA